MRPGWESLVIETGINPALLHCNIGPERLKPIANIEYGSKIQDNLYLHWR